MRRGKARGRKGRLKLAVAATLVSLLVGTAAVSERGHKSADQSGSERTSGLLMGATQGAQALGRGRSRSEARRPAHEGGDARGQQRKMARASGRNWPRLRVTRRAGSRPACLVVRLRVAIHDRRLATWHWLDVLDLPREPTRYRERETRGCHYLRWLRALWAARADATWHLVVKLSAPEAAIRHVFGRYAEEAIAVAECESGLSRHALNGQYRGLFQMGSYARSRYGHGETALEQARSAYRYFVASGRDWSPWSCRP